MREAKKENQATFKFDFILRLSKVQGESLPEMGDFSAEELSEIEEIRKVVAETRQETYFCRSSS